MEACDAVEQGIKSVDKNIEVIKNPIADGGEGTVLTLTNTLGGGIVELELSDPLFRKIKGYYGIINKKTAIMEMAISSGLILLKDKEKNPLYTSTYGVGEMIRHALDRGIRDFIIGIGGSATNDAGIGMLEALGMKFYDKNSNTLSSTGKSLNYITRIDDSNFDNRIKESKFLIASDINNPLFGLNGATYVYGPQKGANQETVKQLDLGLRHFHEIVSKLNKQNYSLIPGAGAAGGLGYAFKCFSNAELKPGVNIVFEKLDIYNIAKNVDMIITGEGKIDEQSAMGKVLSGIGKLGIKYNLPVIALAGIVEKNLSLDKIGITSTFSITKESMILEEGMNKEGTKIRLKNKTTEIIKSMTTIKKER
ncbi:MAG: glycerate kinase [Candidatus Izemoplasmatales bacterium]|nr:glycerate kinase [Candidatus Izemoplasmatales bacterium]